MSKQKEKIVGVDAQCRSLQFDTINTKRVALVITKKKVKDMVLFVDIDDYFTKSTCMLNQRYDLHVFTLRSPDDNTKVGSKVWALWPIKDKLFTSMYYACVYKGETSNQYIVDFNFYKNVKLNKKVTFVEYGNACVSSVIVNETLHIL